MAHSRAIVRSGLVALLQDLPQYRVTSLAEGDDPVGAIRRLHPHVAIVEYASQGSDGPHVLASIARHGLSTAPVMIAERWTGGEIYRLFQEGAAGFLTYGDRPDRVVEVVGRAADPKRVPFGDADAAFREHLRHATVEVPTLRERKELNRPLLTLREIEVLRYAARGFSIQETSQLLRVSVPTVKNHRHSIYSKLGVPNAAAAVSRAWSYGYIP